MIKQRRLFLVMLLVAAAPLCLAGNGEAGKRRKIDARTQATLKQILAESPRARELFDQAIGYAVFTNTKAALGLSGGAGSGVAIDKSSGKRTYMKMGTAGVGLGLGIKRYRVLMLFEKEKVFRSFVEKGWQGDAQAGAVAGTDGVGVQTTFHNGMAVFVRAKKGLMASADVSGTKYWKSDLND